MCLFGFAKTGFSQNACKMRAREFERRVFARLSSLLNQAKPSRWRQCLRERGNELAPWRISCLGSVPSSLRACQKSESIALDPYTNDELHQLFAEKGFGIREGAADDDIMDEEL